MTVTRDALNIVQIRDTALLRAWLYIGQSKRLVLCFSGLGKDQSQPPGYEFSAIATGGGEDSVLYIADPNRSWLNQTGFLDEVIKMVEATKTLLATDQVVTLGHSMGGFSACVLPYFTQVDHVLALSPQVSIHPDIVPDDGRWMQHREVIDTIDIVSVESYLVPATKYVVIYGRHGREAPQRERFPNPDNLWLFVMPHTNHNTASRLKKLGLLKDLRDLVFEGNIDGVSELMRGKARAYLLQADDNRAEVQS